MTPDRRLILLSIAMLWSGAGGCGQPEGPERHVVSGEVTYAGKPVSSGFIAFIPDGRRGNSGPAGMAMIKNGNYQTARDRGVVGGAYVAKVSAYDGTAREVPGEGISPTGKVLVEEFVVELEFPQQDTTQDINVPAQ